MLGGWVLFLLLGAGVLLVKVFVIGKDLECREIVSRGD
jgi:hypothetical protein